MGDLSEKRVLVIGGGAAGLNTALQLAALGVKSLVVEKETALGGHASLLHRDMLTGDSIKKWITSKIDEAIHSQNVESVTSAEVVDSVRVQGGGFKVRIRQRPVKESGTAQFEAEVDAVVVATGFVLFDASKIPQYGYGRYKDVVNNLDFEKLTDPEGPTSGEVMRASDGKRPNSIVFLTCIGSRDVKHNPGCCRVGCPVALNQALIVKEKYGKEVEVYVCYIDMRAVGRGVEECYRKAMDSGIIFIQGQPSEIRPTGDGSLNVELFDTSTSKLLSIRGDLIVLETGLSPNVDLASVLGLDIAEDGFYSLAHPKFDTSTTAVEGVFLAGTSEGPKDIAETLDHSSKTVMKVVEYLLRQR